MTQGEGDRQTHTEIDRCTGKGGMRRTEINRLTGDGACSQCTESQTRDADDAESLGRCHYPILREVNGEM